MLTLTPVVGTSGKYGSAAGRMAYYRELVERVQAVPGVEAVGMVSNVPLSRSEPSRLQIEGQSAEDGRASRSADVFWVLPGYSGARIPLRRGRWLVAHDGDLDGPPAAMISESLARSRFGDGDPIGR